MLFLLRVPLVACENAVPVVAIFCRRVTHIILHAQTQPSFSRVPLTQTTQAVRSATFTASDSAFGSEDENVAEFEKRARRVKRCQFWATFTQYY